MTLLITSITGDTPDTLHARAVDALEHGTDVVELRLDFLADRHSGERAIANGLPSGRWIATCRTVEQGGQSRDSVERRLQRMLAAGAVGEGFIDLEFDDWSRSGIARHDLANAFKESGVSPSLILSHHDFKGRPSNLDQIFQQMCAVDEAVAVKIAWRADDIIANFDAFDLLRNASKETMAICMGEHGLMSRALAGKCSAFGTYGSMNADSRTAPGQPTMNTMLRTYRVNRIDDATHVYGVIGCPVEHSISPLVFNGIFQQTRVNGVYLPLLVDPSYDQFARFMDECLARPWLDVRGFSVTQPHKQNAWRYLGDNVDPPADTIGAVNTIRIEDGEIWGCNTDCPAAIDTLTAALQCTWEELEGLSVDILGAGGVARAIVAGLVDCGARVTLYNRDCSRAESVQTDFECVAHPWDDRIHADGQVLINCTSVGMWPNTDESPMPADALRPEVTVFDAVYNPRETQLLTDARRAGCVTTDGAAMFFRQAAAQFEYWTQQAADEAQFAEIVHRALADHA